MTEIFDVINEQDEVIGQATREECHAQRLLHRFVHGYVVNSQGLILLQWRGHHKANDPRMFDASVGGHVDAGETYEEAVVREALEELGITVTNPIFIGRMDNRANKDSMLGNAFLLHHEGPFTGWQEEADRIEWFSRDEIRVLSSRLPYLFCTLQSFAALDAYLTSKN